MTIFRGPGGTGSATSDSDTTEFQEFLVQSQAARDAALAAQVAAELAETNAETAETNAETAETNAETAATNAASSASAASISASNAATSASNAASSATSAANSASAAAASATEAANTLASTVKLTGDQTIAGVKTFTSTISGSIDGNAATVTNGVVTTGSYSNPTWITSLDDGKVLPSMTGNSGKYLTTDGTNSTWATVDALPDQTGNAGEYLTTNGTVASWTPLNTDANTTTKGLYENNSVISANYSITAGNNAMSSGPITVNSGVTVTVPSGSRWVVL